MTSGILTESAVQKREEVGSDRFYESLQNCGLTNFRADVDIGGQF